MSLLCILLFSPQSICFGDSESPRLAARCSSVDHRASTWLNSHIWQSRVRGGVRATPVTHHSQSSGDRLLLITPPHLSGSSIQSRLLVTEAQPGLLINQIQKLYGKDDTGEQGTKVYSSSHVSPIFTMLKKWRKCLLTANQVPKTFTLSSSRSLCLSLHLTASPSIHLSL